ncbi:MAG: histidine kinase dimerization/phospho-acceptor domain-containing protein [archaeon]
MTEIKEEEKAREIINQFGHYLKTPLTSIKGFTELLQTEQVQNDKDKSIYYLGLINKNSDRLHEAIIDMQKTLWLYLYGKEVDDDENNNGN